MALSVRGVVDHVRYKMGLVTKNELMKGLSHESETYAEQMPLTFREPFQAMCEYSRELQHCKDPEEVYKTLSTFHEFSDAFLKNMNPEPAAIELREKTAQLMNAEKVINYNPAGARMWKYFFNPMGVYTFIGDNHWATKAALTILRTEIGEEGYKLHYVDPDITPARVQEVVNLLYAIEMPNYYVDTAVRFLTYANVYTLPEKNFMGKPFRLTNLSADRMWPKLSHNGEVLEAWEYQIGTGVIMYQPEEVLHLRDFSLRSKHLGSPRLAPLVTDIEADMAASALNSAIMNKAGMIGVIIALEDPALKNPLKVVNMDRQRERLEKTIHGQFTGVRGAHSVLVGNYIRDVFRLADIGSLDASFLKLRMEIAKSVCILLGVPPERLAQSRNASMQYQAASVENIIQASFDKHITAVMNEICAFINKHILKDIFGIYDVEIRPRGRFSANTVNGARMALMASQTGPLFTVNEMRSWFFRVPELPPGDPRGDKVIDNTMNRTPDVVPMLSAVIDPRDQIPMIPSVDQPDGDNADGFNPDQNE